MRVLRCEVTDNPCGTDTWAVGPNGIIPCNCDKCQEYIMLEPSSESSRNHFSQILKQDQSMLPEAVKRQQEAGVPTDGVELLMTDDDGCYLFMGGPPFSPAVAERIKKGAPIRVIRVGEKRVCKFIVNDAIKNMSDEDLRLEFDRYLAKHDINWRLRRMAKCLLVMAGMGPEMTYFFEMTSFY